MGSLHSKPVWAPIWMLDLPSCPFCHCHHWQKGWKGATRVAHQFAEWHLNCTIFLRIIADFCFVEEWFMVMAMDILTNMQWRIEIQNTSALVILPLLNSELLWASSIVCLLQCLCQFVVQLQKNWQLQFQLQMQPQQQGIFTLKRSSNRMVQFMFDLSCCWQATPWTVMDMNMFCDWDSRDGCVDHNKKEREASQFQVFQFVWPNVRHRFCRILWAHFLCSVPHLLLIGTLFLHTICGLGWPCHNKLHFDIVGLWMSCHIGAMLLNVVVFWHITHKLFFVCAMPSEKQQLSWMCWAFGKNGRNRIVSPLAPKAMRSRTDCKEFQVGQIHFPMHWIPQIFFTWEHSQYRERTHKFQMCFIAPIYLLEECPPPLCWGGLQQMTIDKKWFCTCTLVWSLHFDCSASLLVWIHVLIGFPLQKLKHAMFPREFVFASKCFSHNCPQWWGFHFAAWMNSTDLIIHCSLDVCDFPSIFVEVKVIFVLLLLLLLSLNSPTICLPTFFHMAQPHFSNFLLTHEETHFSGHSNLCCGSSCHYKNSYSTATNAWATPTNALLPNTLILLNQWIVNCHWITHMPFSLWVLHTPWLMTQFSLISMHWKVLWRWSNVNACSSFNCHSCNGFLQQHAVGTRMVLCWKSSATVSLVRHALFSLSLFPPDPKIRSSLSAKSK